MMNWQSAAARDEDEIDPAELRLAEMFHQADQLAADPIALNAYLASLSPQDKAEVSTALAYANAIRAVGHEVPPSMTGKARAMLEEAMAADLADAAENLDLDADFAVSPARPRVHRS